MKNLTVVLMNVMMAYSLSAQGGSFIFEDFVSPDTQAWDGEYLGSDYSTGVWWGVTSDPESFTLLEVSVVPYFGQTGGDPAIDGAGLFSIGEVRLLDQDYKIFVQQKIWRGESFESASAWGVGSVFEIRLATGATPPPTIPSESVAVVPEPSGVGLLSVGLVALMLRRRPR